MLDEPTNHLDLEARTWLEDYLASYPGGIILVSHDRYFLDRVTKTTVEVARGRLTEYQGGYSRYLVEREKRFELELAAYEKQREEIAHIEAFISRFRYQASKARLVQSRIKQLREDRAPANRRWAPTSRPRSGFPNASAAGGGSLSSSARSSATARSPCTTASIWRSSAARGSRWSVRTARENRP